MLFVLISYLLIVLVIEKVLLIHVTLAEVKLLLIVFLWLFTSLLLFLLHVFHVLIPKLVIESIIYVVQSVILIFFLLF